MSDLWGYVKEAWHWLTHSFEAAGTIGALISIKWAKGDAFSILFSLFGGLGMAFYIGPGLMEVMEVKSANGLMAGGFMLGTSGAIIIARVVAIIRTMDMKKGITAFLESLLERFK